MRQVTQRSRRPRSRLRFGAVAAFCVAAVWAAYAAGQEVTDEQAAWRAELNELISEIEVTQERQNELRQSFAELDTDRAGLNQGLIETNQRIQELERELDGTEARMDQLVTDEARINAALGERRDVLAQVLAVLQRMGRSPPPAIIVRPEDALGAVRSAILLGAVVPQVRAEAAALAADLQTLADLREDQEIERDRIIASAVVMADEQQRLELLVGERRQALDQTSETLQAEQQRLGALAAEARSLEELINAFGDGDEVRVAILDPALIPEPGPPLILGDADRISPALPFSSARGLLPQPANGDLILGFGRDDGLGGVAKGLSIATRSGARISAPADGWVEFAGPYRSYGNLLIVDAGDGYRIVMSGMTRIDVQRGQFVLAGEPIGAMQSSQLAAVADVDLGTVRPVLYVEFRKDGNSIDPGPWWAVPY